MSTMFFGRVNDVELVIHEDDSAHVVVYAHDGKQALELTSEQMHALGLLMRVIHGE